MRRSVNVLSKPAWGSCAWAVLALCTTGAAALPAQTSGSLEGSKTPSTTTPVLTTLYSFCAKSGCTDGVYPNGGLVQGTNGIFYGTTQAGGANNNSGTVFKIKTSGKLTTLYSFCAKTDCTDGQEPTAGVIQATNGDLYGTTDFGGTNDLCNGAGCGTAFKITLGGTLTTLYSFCAKSACTDGENPLGGLVQASNRDIYGTTRAGGLTTHVNSGDQAGTIFQISPSGTLTTVYTFCADLPCDNGASPYAGLVQGTGGNLYGTTYAGGPYNVGTVFEITPGGTLTTLHTFCSQISGGNCLDGDDPEAGLVEGSDGNFYGTTTAGGASNRGTVFKITPDGTLTTLYAFCALPNCADGFYPQAGLIQGTDGNLYGSTLYGGANCPNSILNTMCGTIFRISTAGALTTLYSFCAEGGSACTDGSNPGGLVQGTDGVFYGTAMRGGANGAGSVFSLSVGLGPFVSTQPIAGKVKSAVKILGTDLTGATSVTFDGMAAAFTVLSPSEISTAVPVGATTGAVQVVTPGGTLSSNVAFQVLR